MYINSNTDEEELSIAALNDEKIIKIYKGNHFSSPSNKKLPNVIVLDLDETLGSFTDLDILHRNLSKYIAFNDLLDLFPEFLRYGIFPILKYIHNEKIKNKCNNVFIYTNNQSHYDIVGSISSYFSNKLGTNDFFNKVIRSFKIGDRIVEINRTTRNKTHDDFIRCTLLPKRTQICFIDNSYFPEMENSRVYYIQPMSYHHHLSKEEIMRRLDCISLSSQERDRIYDRLITFPEATMKGHCDYLEMKKNMDKMVAKKMMYHIRDFFFLTHRRAKTKKRLGFFQRLTRKLRF